jgi:DNA-binding SARP family transcriptional activator/tetratricopeptide (TPR) repeat protein
MEFRLLGPLEVLERDRSLVLGGRKQRALLALLLLHANNAVSRERLIDELWGDAAPATVDKSIHVYVSRLRRQLGDGRLVTRAPGYMLRLDPSESDLGRFERLVAEAGGAHPAAAAQKLREALSLWRGPPLADLAYEPCLQGEILRLTEVRLSALEQRIEADLATGRHAALVGELEALVAEQPLRERLRCQLMLALYRCGRQAEALEVYRETRQALVEQLGIEPSRALRELERAILEQDRSLDLVDEAPASELRSGDFVGRDRELRVLDEALEDALAGRGHVILLAGEPGIGKSRLAAELSSDAHARGAKVLVGRCWEAGGAPPYWPWIQALRALVDGTQPELLREQIAGGAADLAELMPELRDLFPGIPTPPVIEPKAARFRMFESVCTLLRSAAQACPLVLVMDDLHAADEPSLLLLRFMAREIADARLLVIGAHRDVDPAMSDALSAAVAELIREPHVRQLALAGLSEPEVARYIERSSGETPSGSLAGSIAAETEGNPLFVVEFVRLLVAERCLDEPNPRLAIPPGIRAVIGRRVARLSPRCRDLLERASVLGREFGLDVLARMGGFARAELLDALDEALGERVVEEPPAAAGRLRFAHVLIRDTLYDELPAVRRLELHREAADALEAMYAADPEPHVAELAQQFHAAGMSEKAIEYARRAGGRAVSQLAYEEAVRHYESALALVEQPATRCELLLALADAQDRAGETSASRAAYREAADVAQRLGLPELLARAAVGYGGRILWEIARDDERLPLLERALAALSASDSPLRVRLLARLAMSLRGTPDAIARMRALAREALDMSERLGDTETLVYARSAYIPAVESPANTAEMLEAATELLGTAGEIRDLERRFEAHEHRVCRLLELGDVQAARADLDAMDRLADELRQPAQRWLVTVIRAREALLEGRLDEAEGLIEKSLALGTFAVTTVHRMQLYFLRREQGRLEEVEDLIVRTVADYPALAVWRCVRGQMQAELGRTSEARRTFDGLARDGFAALPFQELWIVGMGLLAETAHALGDAEHAMTLHAKLLPYADRVAVSYPEVATGAVGRHLGLLATTMRRWNDAEGHFETALELNERIGAKPWLAHTLEDYARMLLTRGQPWRAQELATRAVAGYRELGMDRHAARAQSLQGVQPASLRPSKLPSIVRRTSS